MVKAGCTIVDLYCGCGGFSLGAELAGFRSLAAIDIDPILQSSYRLNFPRTKTIQGSVADFDTATWRHFLGSERPDGIIGGPPCQGFSRIGKRRKDDPRNSLIHHFYRQVNSLSPKFFVMENVEGLLDAQNVDLLNSGIELVAKRYRVCSPTIVNAANFGAATNRHRVVVIGYDPERMDAVSLNDIATLPPGGYSTVRDAIADLPSPIPDLKMPHNFGWSEYPEVDAAGLSEYAARLRCTPPDGLGWDEAIAKLQSGVVSGMFSTMHSKAVAKRYSDTLPGKCDPISRSQKLAWNGLSPTLRAGTGSDKGSYQAVRPLHPSESRVITVREAARLQGFPDWFVFHPAKWHSFRMIGNSVSPLVSYALLHHLHAKLAVPLAA
ncbi:MAG: DNA cytosine methyltransferase [Desulfovibrio sp.]